MIWLRELLLIVWSIFTGFAFAEYRRHRKVLKAIRDAENAPLTPGWNRLPSGWARNYGPRVVGLVSTQSSGTYWWVMRDGRTLVEGEADSVDGARQEVEKTAEWLSA